MAFLPKNKIYLLLFGALTGLMLGLLSSQILAKISPYLYLPVIMTGIFLAGSILIKIRHQQADSQLHLLKIYQLASLGNQTSGLLHDLANPLTGLNLSLYQLTKQSDDHYLNQALTCSQKIQKVIEANRVQFQNQTTENTFNLKTTVEQALEILHYPLIKQNVKVNLKADYRAELFGQQNNFRQIIINLLNNAIEAYRESKQFNKQIEIDLKINPDHYVLTIRDQAGGISGSDLDKIFDPLFSTKNGPGMGLYLTKKIITDNFNGRINVINCPGQGTKFCLIIPFG